MTEAWLNWTPQPKQLELFEAAGLLEIISEQPGAQVRPPLSSVIGYGGAAYGGKTDAQLGLGFTICLAYPGANVALFRRTFPELNVVGGVIKRSQEIIGGSTDGLAWFNVGEHTWTFVNGSRLQFCYCQNENDVLKYKSSQFDVLLIDEATSFTWFMVDYLMTRNRATIPGIKPFTVMTTNPGDVGHSWYMQVFDTIKALGKHNQVKQTENPNGKRQAIYFIPAFIDDNLIGKERDPEYAARLAARDPDVARALLAGDWSVFAGQAFPQWRFDRHVQPYQDLPPEWPMWRSMDYGWQHPYVIYWWKQNPQNGRRYLLRELTGQHQTDPAIIQAVKTASLPDERILFTFASPDMWAAQRSNELVTTAAQNFSNAGLILTRAEDARIPGKLKVNNLLADLPDGMPGLVVFDNCTGLIRQMPTLVRDKLHPEDVQKMDGDDFYDAMRYGLTNYTLPQLETVLVRPQLAQRNRIKEVFGR